jgi:hypothetical protein
VFSAPSIRQLAAVPLGALLAAVLLLTGPANAPAAKPAKPTCASKASTKAKRDAHRRACPARKHKTRSKTHRGHVKHVTKTGLPSATAPSSAFCENGAAPRPEGGGSFSCADGSEPSCEAGFEAAPSSSGSALVCVAAPANGNGSTSGDLACEEQTGQPCGEEGSEQAPENVEGST